MLKYKGFAIITLIVLLGLALTTTTSFANEAAKPTVSLIIAPGFTGFFAEDKTVITQAIVDCFTRVLSKDYNIVNGDKYIGKLQKSGINDFASVERNDLIEVVSGENVGLIVYISFPQPDHQGTMHPLIATHSIYRVQVKIIDPTSKKTIYTNTFQDHGSTPKRAMKKLIPKMEETLANNLPSLLHPLTNNPTAIIS